MRILFVTPYYKPYLGGVERVIENLSKEFIKSGHEVAVLTSKYSFPRTYHAEWVHDEVIDGVEVFRLNSWPHQPLPFYAAPLTLFSPLEIRSIVNRFKSDAVIYMTDKWFGVNFLVRPSSSRSKQIWCPIFHDLTLAKILLRPINWLFGKAIDKVIVVTKLEAEKVKKAYGVTSRKINIIPWGVSLNNEKQITNNNTVTVLAVGRISRHKGQKWLVERFLEVITKTTVPCRLVLVGEVEEPQELEAIRSLLSRVGERQKMVEFDFTANDQKLTQYYKDADIFALIPEYESFGLVFLEALSYGVPVLTHKVGALEEVLREGAVLTAPFDQESVSTSLLRMINDVAYRKELGEKGRQFVVQNYSWKKCAGEYLRFLLEKGSERSERLN